MEDILAIAYAKQKEAYEIIKKLKINESWNDIDAQVNLIGSLKTELLIKNLDIDFHVYTKQFSITESFKAISKIADNSGIKEVAYKNLIEEEDRCLEWHMFYEDEKQQRWQIDIIHLLNDSPYVGYFERVAERISTVLTGETKEAILKIKYMLPETEKVSGINIYKAVIKDGIRNIDDFLDWYKNNQDDGIVDWMP